MTSTKRFISKREAQLIEALEGGDSVMLSNHCYNNSTGNYCLKLSHYGEHDVILFGNEAVKALIAIAKSLGEATAS